MDNGLGIIDEDSLNIFTDGSSFHHDKRRSGVGISLVWVSEDGHELTHDYSPPGWISATSDEMEIMACVEGLQEAQLRFVNFKPFNKVIIFTDSQYVRNNFLSAMNVWPKTKWRLSNDIYASNIEIWKILKREVDKIPIKVEVRWVKGHKSNFHNRRVDKLAKESASNPLRKPLSVIGTTSKQSPHTTKRGCVPVLGQVLSIRIIGWKYLKSYKATEYRYEIIDKESKHYQMIDFLKYKQYLSRHHCYLVRVNDNMKNPWIVEVLDELEPNS